MSNNKDSVFEDKLDELTKKRLDSDKIETYLNDLKQYFSEKKRYKKLSISQKIIQLYKKDNQGFLLENILEIKEINEKYINGYTHDINNYHIRTLLNIILSEIEWCSHIFYKADKFESYILSKEKDIKQALEDIRQTRNELTTILGIFTAIVIGFVGQMAFSSSTLSNLGNIDNVNPFGFAFVLSSVTFGFINLICILVSFIFHVLNKDNPHKESQVDDKKTTNTIINKDNEENINISDNLVKETTNETTDETNKKETGPLGNAWRMLNAFLVTIMVITFYFWIKTK